ncbi:MAG: SDR family NAD(P)-dependent oxidoreductase, partial [Sandaracinaceae bacterium]
PASLAGRTYAITGANTGVGRATACALAARGARVILACRNADRTQAVLRDIDAVGGSAVFVPLELGSLASVARAAEEIADFGPLDGLINNAAVGGARGITEDGFELAFGVNFLGHVQLTELLLDALAPDGRVVHLGSGSHEGVRALSFDAMRGRTRSRTAVSEYAASKLCVMLYHATLAERFRGTARRSVAADPGDVASDAYRHIPQPFRALWTCRMPPPEVGALTPTFCAVDDSVQNGLLYADCRERAPSALATDIVLARELIERARGWIAEVRAAA